MARMLGHFGSGECGCTDCSPPRGRHSAPLSSRWRKRIEARQWPAAELGPREPLPAPFTDYSDCRHGCNGGEIVSGYGSDVCDWLCHPDLTLDPERAAKWDAVYESIVNL
jgi:hypothetical protein